MSERDIGLEILEGIREIKAFKAGKIELKTRELKERSPLRAVMKETPKVSKTLGASLNSTDEP